MCVYNEKEKKNNQQQKQQAQWRRQQRQRTTTSTTAMATAAATTIAAAATKSNTNNDKVINHTKNMERRQYCIKMFVFKLYSQRSYNHKNGFQVSSIGSLVAEPQLE